MKKDHVHIEHAIYREFVRVAHINVDDTPREDEVLEWLALMRHYEAPTRLLDWSYSFWVALFFAAEGARQDDQDARACVWVVDDEWVQAAASKIMTAAAPAALKKHQDDPNCRDAGTFHELYVAPRRAFVMKQNCWRRNARLVVQQGVFLCPGDVDHCFQSNLGAMLDSVPANGGPPIRRVEFRARLASEILQRLQRLGISYASVYPDLEGLARSLQSLPRIPALHAAELTMLGVGKPATRTET